MDRQAALEALPRIDAIPFESEHKFMATLHRSENGREILFAKGAPEVITGHCDRQQSGSGEAVALDREYFMQLSDRLAGQGEGVLALAWIENPGLNAGTLEPADLPKNLILIGLLDRPRQEAIEAVKACHEGGIRVTMITGDHKITAAVAKMLGIGDDKTAVMGAEIEETNEVALRETVRNIDDFARTSPEHKLCLVKAIQANKQIVAMTGDGVNDAPSLKKADIGVAMGIKVTKEAAGMILTGFGIWRVIFVGLALVAYTLWAFFWMMGTGASEDLARTLAVNAITIGQAFYLLNSRFLLDSSLLFKAHLGNKHLPMGIGAVVVLQVLFTYAPPLQALFDTESIPLRVWPWLFLGGILFFGCMSMGIRAQSAAAKTIFNALLAGASRTKSKEIGIACGHNIAANRFRILTVTRFSCPVIGMPDE
jgi:magnesium-transporting ATPase (P-type)